MLVSVAGSAIIQIPQMARNRIAAEKAILDRAQKQPQHSHGTAQQQPSPVVSVQNPARYGEAPPHGHADRRNAEFCSIWKSPTPWPGRYRSNWSAKNIRRRAAARPGDPAAEKTGKDEQPQCQAKLCDGFSLYGRHSPTSEPSLPAILILPYKRWKSQHFKSEWPPDCALRRFRRFYCLFSSCLTLKSASMRAFHSAPKGALHRTAETASLSTS